MTIFEKLVLMALDLILWRLCAKNTTYGAEQLYRHYDEWHTLRLQYVNYELKKKSTP